LAGDAKRGLFSYPLTDHSGVAVTESTEDLSFFDIVGNVRAMRRLKPDPVSMNVMWKVLNAGVQDKTHSPGSLSLWAPRIAKNGLLIDTPRHSSPALV
jgi:hypothetical protein